MDGTVKRPKIRYCHISDPFVLILREDDSLGLFVGDAERGRIRRKDMTPMGEKVWPSMLIVSGTYSRSRSQHRYLVTLLDVSIQIIVESLNLTQILALAVRTRSLLGSKRILPPRWKQQLIHNVGLNGLFFVGLKASWR